MILLVEDEPTLREPIARELSSLGFTVVTASDGEEALEVFRKEKPDLVILDWLLPRLDGLSVLGRLRSVSAVPILMLTARAEEADRVIGLELGADDYLVKPFSMRELVARVRALLRRDERLREEMAKDREPEDGSVTVGRLVVSPAEGQARLGDLVLDLTPHELRLLHLLARHPGRVFSRTYLLETLWTERPETGDRAVDNVVMRLRKKLGAEGSSVETVWGVGYRLTRP